MINRVNTGAGRITGQDLPFPSSSDSLLQTTFSPVYKQASMKEKLPGAKDKGRIVRGSLLPTADSPLQVSPSLHFCMRNHSNNRVGNMYLLCIILLWDCSVVRLQALFHHFVTEITTGQLATFPKDLLITQFGEKQNGWWFCFDKWNGGTQQKLSHPPTTHFIFSMVTFMVKNYKAAWRQTIYLSSRNIFSSWAWGLWSE